MNKKNAYNLDEADLLRLLNEINQLDDDFQPASLEEVEAIEKTFRESLETLSFDENEDQYLDELRKASLDDINPIDSILKRAQQLQLSPQDLLDQVQLSTDILFKLEQRVFDWVPDTLVVMLAQSLQVSKAQLYYFLLQEPEKLNVAASSLQTPTKSRRQSWQEAIETSSMSDGNKTFWLHQS